MSPRGRPRLNREPKRKAVKVRLAPREHGGKITEPYRIMEAIIATDRPELQDLKIGIAWHTGWRPDADGVRTFGKCLNRSDLDRSMDGFDFLIVLNEQSWLAFDQNRKEREVFHQLEHAQICRDKNGEPMLNDKGWVVTRIRKHDIGDFRCVIERFRLPENLTDIEIADAGRGLLRIAEEKAGERETGNEADSCEKAAGGLAREPILKEIKPGLKKLVGGIAKDGRITQTESITIPMPKGVRGLAEIHFAEIDGKWYGGYRLEATKVDRKWTCSVHETPYASEVQCLHAMTSRLAREVQDLPAKFMNDVRKAKLTLAIDQHMAKVCQDLELKMAEAQPLEFAEDPEPQDGSEE